MANRLLPREKTGFIDPNSRLVKTSQIAIFSFPVYRIRDRVVEVLNTARKANASRLDIPPPPPPLTCTQKKTQFVVILQLFYFVFQSKANIRLDDSWLNHIHRPQVASSVNIFSPFFIQPVLTHCDHFVRRLAFNSNQVIAVYAWLSGVQWKFFPQLIKPVISKFEWLSLN